MEYLKRGLAIEDATNFVFSRKTGRRSFGNFNPEIEVFFYLQIKIINIQYIEETQ